ncbi:acyl-CoA dehydrogenase/oxidase [Tricharina praecox]|uniref:acyl-CoA dehydrogenase/oxidase n=1 Tax=Tricharina praecox TaxID=43433 RepID=UPI002220223C|nr:acyl-CoA dehydrogenase/oxidase [Tricharina praecox]KAI5856300.1 acyl-CoA dehydrogenase/oxidase [Tricharina praecox]
MSCLSSLRPHIFRAARQLRPRAPISHPSYLLAAHRLASTKQTTTFKAPTSEDLTELRERVQEFTRREIPEEFAAQVDKSNEFPSEMWEKMGSAGFLGITAEEDYGGLDMGYQAHCVVMEELSRASASIGLSYAAHSQLCINQLTLHGTKEQKERWLPGLISGELVGALAMSEHSAGSDVVSMRSGLKKSDGGGWVLNGTKMWITNGPDADVVVVYAKSAPDAGSKGITATIVEKGMKGFSIAQKLDKLGMRGSNTGELVFEDVEIPAENQLGEENKGARVLMSGLDLERLVLSAGPIGIMQKCLDVTLPYVHARKQFGIPIAHNQLIQAKLADMHVKLAAARAYTYAAARSVDEGTIDTRDCAGAIMFASDRAVECALDTIQCMGGNGYINEIPAGRLLRDSKLYTIGAGSTEVRQIVIGRSFNKEFA